MFQFVSDTIAGGWNAVSNIGQSLSGGAGQAFGNFFPTPQIQTPITAQITQPVISNPLINYRPTSTDALSLSETAQYAYDNWLGSPFEDQYGVNKVAPSGIFDPWGDAVANLWNAATGAFSKINDQLPTIMMQKWGLIPTPDPQNSQNEVVYQVLGSPSPTPDTHAAGEQAQPAGLFSLGFPQWGSAPVVPIPGTNQTLSVGTLSIVAVALIGIFLLAKK